jgi:hypothetical protein
MISTKKQFHPLDENPRHSNLSLTKDANATTNFDS